MCVTDYLFIIIFFILMHTRVLNNNIFRKTILSIVNFIFNVLRMLIMYKHLDNNKTKTKSLAPQTEVSDEKPMATIYMDFLLMINRKRIPYLNLIRTTRYFPVLWNVIFTLINRQSQKRPRFKRSLEKSKCRLKPIITGAIHSSSTVVSVISIPTYSARNENISEAGEKRLFYNFSTFYFVR